MPPAPFDYYAQLGVEKSASQQDIISAFRRLARVCHPDKNLLDQAQATASFQRLQTAYETLSNPSKRCAYDTTSTPPRHDGGFPSSQAASPGPDGTPDPDDDSDFEGSFFYDYYEDDLNYQRYYSGEWEDNDWEEELSDYDFFTDHPFPGDRFGFNFGSSPFDPPRDSVRTTSRQAEEERRQEDALRAYLERVQDWQNSEDARARRREEVKKAMADAAEKERARRQNEEALTQAARWQAHGAVTKDERRETCMHSEFCTKNSLNKKFKCDVCGVKRGKLAFECPYCSVYLCQLCVTVYADKRAGKSTPKAKTDEHATPKTREYVFPETETETGKYPDSKEPMATSENDTQEAHEKEAAAKQAKATKISEDENKDSMSATEEATAEPQEGDRAEVTNGSKAKAEKGTQAKQEGNTNKKSEAHIEHGTEAETEILPDTRPSVQFEQDLGTEAHLKDATRGPDLRRCDNKENIPPGIQTSQSQTGSPRFPRAPEPPPQRPEPPQRPAPSRRAEPLRPPRPPRPTPRPARKPKFKSSTSGPEPGYGTDGRHKRCLKLHGGGDARCFVLHPEFRQKRNTEERQPGW